MYQYETLYVQRQECGEAQQRENNEKVRRLIEGMGAQILDLQEWGMRELAYPIQKQTRGSYVLVQYCAKAEVVKELERNLKISDDILRFVSVRVDEKAAAAARERQAKAAKASEASGEQEA